MKKSLLIAIVLLCGLVARAQQGSLLVASGDLIDEGIKLHDKRKYREAISKYEQVSKSDTNYSWAVYEIALSYNAMENYAKAVETLLKGIQLNSSRDHQFYNLLGSAYDEMDSFDLSIKYLNEGIAKYPNYYLTYYNRGVTLLNMKKDKEAFESFKKALELNYYHVRSHVQIGHLAYKYGMMAPALMCYQMALIFEPGSPAAIDGIGNMLKIMKAEEMNPEDKSKFIPYLSGNNDFEDIDQIILSKVALDEKYKSKTKIKDKYLNQLQILCEKLAEKGEDKGFFMTTYGWFFQKVYAANHYPGMTYLMFSALENQQKVVNANKSKLTAFKDFAIRELVDYRSARPLAFNGQTYTMKRYFNDNGSMDAMGEVSTRSKDIRVGKWFIFSSNGNVSAAVEFDDEGQRTGTWTWYHPNGQVSETASYRDNKITGVNKEYTRDGVLTVEANYKDGKLDGAYTTYYFTGQLHEKSTYKNGERDGLAKVYYRNGSRMYEVTYKDGEKTYYIAYFYNDSLNEKYAMKDGNAEGPYVSYYNNGMLSAKGKYEEDKQVGEWVYYYRNGKKKSEGRFDKGKLVGTWIYYHDNGAMEHKEEYDEEGKIKGWIKVFDEDSVLHYEYFYERGKIRKYNFYDKQGKVISSAQEKGGKLPLKRYYPEGVLEIEGTLNDGERDGMWLFYDRTGALESKSEYHDGKQEGLYETYFTSGKIKVRTTLKDGDYDGYYTRYYANGKVDCEGWYVKDEMQGDWFYYHSNGNLSGITYYLNDDIDGHEEFYNEAGQLATDYFHENGYTNRITTYDTLGNVVADNKLNHGQGAYKTRYVDGKVKMEGRYRNGSIDSVRTGYFRSGKVRTREEFYCNRRVGKYVAYYENGKVSTEGGYFFDYKQGVWKDYYENGKPEQVTNWEYGDKEGLDTWYYDNGQIEGQGMYHEGMRVGWFTFYEPGGLVRYKIRYLGGEAQAYTYLDKDGKFVPEISLNHGNGKLKSYFQNGSVSCEMEYKNGWLTGTRVLYYPNGKVHREEQLVDGDFEGTWKEYYPSGKLKVLRNYSNDELNGTCYVYFENGKVEKEENYILDTYHGARIKYDMTGKVIERKNYIYGEETN